MADLKVMKARPRRTLDPEGLVDPLGSPETPGDPEAPSNGRAATSSPKAAGRPKPSGRATKRTGGRRPAGAAGSGDGARGSRGSHAAVADGGRDDRFGLLRGVRDAVGIMFDPDIWERLEGLVGELRAEREVRLSVNALLVLALADGLPDGEQKALDLVGRRELELADRGPTPRREQHTVRVSRELLERYSALGAAVRREGFVGARSALVNAVIALEGPSDLAGAADLEQAARRARAAPLVQAA